MAHKARNIYSLVPYRKWLPFSVPDSELEVEMSLFITKVSIKYRTIIPHISFIICTVFSHIVFGFMLIKNPTIQLVPYRHSDIWRWSVRLLSPVLKSHLLSAYNHALALLTLPVTREPLLTDLHPITFKVS